MSRTFASRGWVGLVVCGCAQLIACSGYVYNAGGPGDGQPDSGAPEPAPPDPQQPNPGEPTGPACLPVKYESALERVPVDIVIVVDGSGSMAGEAQRVQANLNAFSQAAASSGTDLRIVMIASAGFVVVPPPLANQTDRYRFIHAPVESWDAMVYMMSKFSAYKAFLRPNAKTHFVVVSDDTSGFRPECFRDVMESYLGHPFQYHAIVSESVSGVQPPPLDNAPMCHCDAATINWAELYDPIDGSLVPPPCGWTGPVYFGVDACHGAQVPGTRHIQLAQATNGIVDSICTSDWSATFGKLLSSVNQSALPCEFDVPSAPAGYAADPNDVKLFFAPQAGARSALVRTTAAACGAGDWYLDTTANPVKIKLCPSMCGRVSDEGGAIDVEWECAVPVL